MVIGVSAGVGKSTFARRLGEYLKIDVFHLDTLYWKPGWVVASTEDFMAAQKEILSRNNWIIEGNYSNSFDLRSEYADTIIYLELPLIVCLYRVVKRWLTNIGKTRPDMGEGCNEKLDWEFIKFIITTYSSRKKKMKTRLFTYQRSKDEKEIVILKGKKEIHAYLLKMKDSYLQSEKRN